MSTENNFTIRDNSQILSILPKEWSIPLIIIAKVKGYESVDSYVLEIIRDRLEMFIDTRDELGEDFQKYMQKIEGLEGLNYIETTTSTTIEDKGASELVKDVHENYHDWDKSEDKDKEDLK